MLQRAEFGYDPASGLFAMVAGTQTVRLWDLSRLGDDECPQVGRLQGDYAGIAALALGRGQMVTVHETGLVRGWSLEAIREGEPDPQWQLDLQLVVSEVTTTNAGPNGEPMLAVGAVDGQVVVCRVDGEDQPRRFAVEQSHDDQIEVLAFSEDARRLATASRDRVVSVWSLESLSDPDEPISRVRRLEGMEGWPLSAEFSNNARRLVCGGMDNGVYFWDLEADDPLEQVRFDHAGWVEDVAFTRGDEAVVSAAWDNTVGVFGTENFQPRLQFMYHDDYVVRVLPLQDSSLLFAASYDGQVSVWDWQQGKLEGVLRGHDDWVTGLVQLNEELVVSLSSDRTARVWSVEQLREVATLGESLMEGFELGGQMDLESFGLGEPKPRLEGEGRAGVEHLQPKVVRRFDPSDSSGASGEPRTAMSMLEQAVDRAEETGVSLDDFDAAGEQQMDLEAIEAGLAEEADSKPQPDSPDGESSMGDELSSLVQEAISEAGEVDEPEEDTGESTADAELQQALDEAVSSPQPGADATFEELDQQQAEPGDLGDASDVEREDPGQPEGVGSDLDEFGVDFEQEDSSGAEIGEFADEAFDDDADEGLDIMDSVFDSAPSGSPEDPSQPDETPQRSDEQPDQREDGPQPPSSDVQQGSGNGEGGLGIMDSVFDPASGGSEQDGDQYDGGGDEQSGEIPDEHGSSDASDTGGGEETAESQREISDVLPDEDELEMAFSSSFSEVVDEQPAAESSSPEDDDASGAVPGKPHPAVGDESSGALEADGSDAPETTGETTQRPGRQRSGTLNPFDSSVRTDRTTGAEQSDPAQTPSPKTQKPGRDRGSEDVKTQPLSKPGLGGGEHGKVGDEPTVSSETTGADTAGPSGEGLGEAETSSRLVPGESVDGADLEVPEPEDSDAKSVRAAGDSPGREVEWSRLWQKGQKSAPMMGILRRRPVDDAQFRPQTRINTAGEGPLAVAMTEKYRLVTADAAGTVQIWDDEGEQLHRFSFPQRNWVEVGILKGERFVYGIDANGELVLWLLPEQPGDSAGPIEVSSVGSGGVNYRCGRLDEQGRRLLAGGQSGVGYLWDLPEGRCVMRLENHDTPVCDVAFGERGPITAGAGGTIRFWNAQGMQIDQINRGRRLEGIEAHDGTVMWIEAGGAVGRTQEGASGDWVTGGEDGRLLVYGPSDQNPRQEIQVPAPVQRLAVGARKMAVASPGGVVFVFQCTSR